MDKMFKNGKNPVISRRSGTLQICVIIRLIDPPNLSYFQHKCIINDLSNAKFAFYHFQLKNISNIWVHISNEIIMQKKKTLIEICLGVIKIAKAHLWFDKKKIIIINERKLITRSTNIQQIINQIDCDLDLKDINENIYGSWYNLWGDNLVNGTIYFFCLQNYCKLRNLH
jgi:hypothetical protein